MKIADNFIVSQIQSRSANAKYLGKLSKWYSVYELTFFGRSKKYIYSKRGKSARHIDLNEFGRIKGMLSP